MKSRVGMPLGQQCLPGNLPSGGPWGGAWGDPGGAGGGPGVDLEDTGFQASLSFLYKFEQVSHLFLDRFVDTTCSMFLKPILNHFGFVFECFTPVLKHLFDDLWIDSLNPQSSKTIAIHC